MQKGDNWYLSDFEKNGFKVCVNNFEHVIS